MHNHRSTKESCINNEELSSGIQLYLQGIGKYTCTQDIINFTKKDDVQKHYGFTKPISLTTARSWIKELGYCWTKGPKGQYVDGYKHKDMVKYRQEEYLPTWNKFEDCLHVWTDDTIHLKVDKVPNSNPDVTNTVVWFHNKSTFYAHDCCDQYWHHETECPKPQPKGKGVSLMVAHFISADYGYLQSPDGTETACVLFQASKGHDGYYTNNHIIQHAEKAIEILQKYYPNDDHILVFDNATMHVK